MQSIRVNAIDLLGAAIGYLLICRLSASPRYRAWLWPTTLVLGAALAFYVFKHTLPETLFNDFQRTYWVAGHAVLDGPQALAGTYDSKSLVFVNLPLVAYLFAPFGWLESWPAAIVYCVLGVGIVVLIWRLLVRLYALDERDSALVAFSLAIYGPMAYSFREGNTSHFILALLLGGLALNRGGRSIAAGVLFAVAAIVKPALVVVSVLYLLRGRWRVAAGTGATLAVAAGLSLAIFGWDMHVLWYRTTIEPYSGGAVPAYAVQTFAAVFIREQLGGPVGFDWNPHALSPANRLAAQAASAVLLAIAAAAALWSRRVFAPSPRDLELETLLAITFALLASPLSWAHYYVWLIPAFVAAYVETRPGSRMQFWRWPTVAAFALAMPIAWVSRQGREGAFGPAWNLVASHWLFGAVVIFVVLAALRSQRQGPGSD